MAKSQFNTEPAPVSFSNNTAQKTNISQPKSQGYLGITRGEIIA